MKSRFLSSGLAAVVVFLFITTLAEKGYGSNPLRVNEDSELAQILAVAGIIFAICFPIIAIFMLIGWSNMKKKVRTIRCRRCNYIGPPKIIFQLGRGNLPVCPKCQGDDWVLADKSKGATYPSTKSNGPTYPDDLP